MFNLFKEKKVCNIKEGQAIYSFFCGRNDEPSKIKKHIVYEIKYTGKDEVTCWAKPKNEGGSHFYFSIETNPEIIHYDLGEYYGLSEEKLIEKREEKMKEFMECYPNHQFLMADHVIKGSELHELIVKSFNEGLQAANTVDAERVALDLLNKIK